MARPTIRILIVQDLHYCCLWKFFSLYKNSALVASRLGVTTRAVNYLKKELEKERPGCEGKPNCLECRKIRCPQQSS